MNAELQDLFNTVVGVTAPGEEEAVKQNFAAYGALKKDNLEGLGIREQLVKTSQDRGTALGDAKAKVLETITQGRELSNSERAAMILFAALPILAGGILKGKKGIAKGAEAGGLAASLMAKGFESDTKRTQDAAKLQLDAIQDQESEERKFQQQALLAEASAQDTSREKSLDRATSTQNAAIRAGGDAAAGKAIALALKENALDKSNREIERIKAPIPMGDKGLAVPSKAVDKETSDKMAEAVPYYEAALTHLNDIIETSRSMDFGAFQRSLGDTGSDLHQKFVLAQNAIMAVKRIPGLKGTDAITNLDKFIGTPASLMRNLYKSIPGVGSVPGEYQAAKKNLEEDFKVFLKANRYSHLKLGDETFIGGTPHKITAVYPDGSFDAEPVGE